MSILPLLMSISPLMMIRRQAHDVQTISRTSQKGRQ